MAIGDGVSAIASLAVTFGGFSPTVMDGVEASKEVVEKLEQAQAVRRQAEQRRREIERARASAPKRYTDESGMQWIYVVMDQLFVRIDHCKREVAFIEIPAEIEGLPVRAVGSDVFHESDVVEEIICPDSIESIGSCAFRFLPNLKRIVFPGKVSVFYGSWLQHCETLEEIVLPGLLGELSSAVFDNPSLRRLYVGAHVAEVKQGACEKTQLDFIEIDPSNPFVKTDGDAIYSADGTELIALVRPVRQFCIPEGCTSMAKKACMGIDALQSVEIPNTVQRIGEFAFSHTGLKSVDIPASVREVAEKAFYYCADLESVTLHEGLLSIGDSAFEESALREIHLPASIEGIGSSITERTNVVHSGEGVTFEVSPNSKTFYFDGEGGLYRRREDGMHFIQLIDREEASYAVIEGTRFIDDYAFAFHSCIREVSLPEGVEEIGRSAFRVCSNLHSVRIPESLKRIGKEAFLDTVLDSIYLPAGFEELSDDALITLGAHRIGDPPSLRTITVHPDNRRFYVESGLLCRRGADGDRGIVFNDNVANVVIPDEVTSIADFAFCNARNINTVSIGPNLRTIGTNGFSTWCYIDNIHIELEKPVEGRTVFDVHFPNTPRAIHEISISLGGSSWVNVPDIFRHYDNCLANARNYHNPTEDDISAYEQAKLMIARLKEPIMLVAVNKSMFERTIREYLTEMCIDIARHDDRSLIDDLCDFGFLNSGNLEDITVAVGRLQDAAMTGYLLELKRRRFGRAAFDFDL